MVLIPHLHDAFLVFVVTVSHASPRPPLSVGSDFWTESERNLFSAALGTHGKDFSLIQKMVFNYCLSVCCHLCYMHT